MTKQERLQVSALAHHDFSVYPFDAVIVGNGDFPTHPIALRVLKEAPYKICCDGAANAAIAHGIIPDLIIGDGDSIADEIALQYAALLLTLEDQETNDQTKAVNHCVSLGKKRIAIVGATGKREDHTLGNISLLMHYYPEITVVSFTDYGLFLPVSDAVQLHTQAGQQISIFNFGAKGLSSQDFRYPIYDFKEGWQGTLNEATTSCVNIAAQGTYLLFLNYCSAAKD